MGFFVLGVNHKECPIEVREKLHFTPAKIEAALQAVRNDLRISELVILSTCNRVEFCGFSESPELPEQSLSELIEETHEIGRSEFAPYFYRYEGEDAIRHLFRVASGLDSLVVGENEILGQLREAFRAANAAGTVHSVLYRLMEKALKIGKDVRAQTKINEGAVSIPAAAVELAEKIFGRLAGEKIMVFGTGEMGTLTLKSLKHSGAETMFIVSRNEERGDHLAREFGGECIAYDAWEQSLPLVDIVIASTSAPHPVIKCEQIKQVMGRRRHRPLFLIDIAVPRNVDSQVQSIDDVYLYNLDDLKGVASANLKLRRHEIKAAENLVEKAVAGFKGWLAQLEARPTLEQFETFLNEVLETELGRLSAKGSLDETQKKEIRERIRAKLLHPPLQKIKEASQNGGVTRYLEAIRSLFGLEPNQKTDDRGQKKENAEESTEFRGQGMEK